MQTRSEEFRAHAAECQELSNHYGDLIKQQYEQLARQWLFLAEQATASEAHLKWVSTWKDVRDLKADHRQSPLAPRQLRIIQI